MGVIATKQIAVLVGLSLILCLPAEAQRRRGKSQLTEEDRKRIVSAVFADGFEELNAQLGGSSILDGCPDLILGNERVAFVSTKNIEPKFAPKIAGVHFEFMTPTAIEEAVKANDKHCYFEFTRFELIGPRVVVLFGRYLKKSVSTYGEAFKYEYTKVGAKWQGKYIEKTNIQS